MTVRLDDSVIKFPSYDLATNGILAIGGNLSKEWLILAYTKGIFPFFNSDSDEISWWFPETRAVMEPGDMKVNKSLKKCINKKKFQIKADQNFSKVIKLCASTRRAYSGTWITENMIDAYCKLHQCNIAHSIEVYEDNNLSDAKSTNINVLLNRVKLNKKKESRQKIIFTAATSLGLVLFSVLIF